MVRRISGPGAWLLAVFLAATQIVWAAEQELPAVINAAQTARAGDIIGFQGAYFGDSPTAVLQASSGSEPVTLERVNAWGGMWASFRLPPDAKGALVVRVGNAVGQSAPVKLNAATPFHLDSMRLSAGGKFRVFGRNLLLPGSVPTVMVDGKPATLDLTASDENMLVATAPTQLQTKQQVEIWVDNGNGTGATLLDRSISSVTGNGKDPFSLGVGWGNAFTGISGRRTPVNCNGTDDDSAALQASIDLAAATGGGVVVLPAGTCRINKTVNLKSQVVLQGAGKSATVLVYATNYPLMGRGIRLAGLSDFSLRNATGTGESALLQNSDQVFFQNVAFELQGGLHMFLTGNRNFVIDHCDFVQPKNPRDFGPFVVSDSAGLVFTNNQILFANGSPDFSRVHDAYIADNHITRDVRNNLASKGIVHSMALDFAYRIAIVNNLFDVLGGPVTNKTRNDGETLLTEGGAGDHTENIGYITSATAFTLTAADVTRNPRPFLQNGVLENHGLAIVGGKGLGQTRRIVGYSNTTLTVDRAWDIVPDNTSLYASFVWGLEKALIKGNTLSQNPRGIWLYQTAVRDVDILSNRITEGGGIYLRSTQNLKDRFFTPMFGIKVADNQIANSTGEWPSYIHLAFVRIDEADFGFGFTGVEVRGNTLQANRPTISLKEEESGGVEGLLVRTRFEGDSQGRSKNQGRMLGTIFQNNRCTGCSTEVLVREGALATVLDGNTN